VTLEPGAQLELSSLRAPDLPGLVSATRSDLSAIDLDLRAAGLRPGSTALDAVRPPRRSLDHPRYAAMQRYFDQRDAVGRTMMCSTAAIQVCVDAGRDGSGPDSATNRWRRLHLLAPVLVAMFANSPFRDGIPNGWRSNRQAVWLSLDPQRSRPPALDTDPRAAWASYALDASVLCIRTPHSSPAGSSWDAPPGLTMRAWLRGEGPREATRADLDYHLTTLFPPVRPRGFLEIRVVDTQAGADWEVAVAVVAALTEDERAAGQAAEACAQLDELPSPMLLAARDGMSHPAVADVAEVCAKAAQDALPGLGADDETRARVAAFIDRYTAVGRCPADDRLDSWARTGRVDPFDPDPLDPDPLDPDPLDPDPLEEEKS
jgi:glutamate--cysteine ligase